MKKSSRCSYTELLSRSKRSPTICCTIPAAVTQEKSAKLMMPVAAALASVMAALAKPPTERAASSAGTPPSGAAPAARLFFHDLGVGNSDTLCIPADAHADLYAPSHAAGARLHSHSWGFSGSTAYTYAEYEVVGV